MPQSKSVYFFATHSDIGLVLCAAESQRRLQYTQAGMFDTRVPHTVLSYTSIPSLGYSLTGDSNLDPFWIITDADSTIRVAAVPQRRGGMRYRIDPALNPESVVMWPGGVYGESCIIAGQFATVMSNKTSLELQVLLSRALRERFVSIRTYLVGPEAERCLDSGWRLAHGVKAASECDLSRNG